MSDRRPFDCPCRRRSGHAAAATDQSGFTLIEVMVALVVFALAALALVRLEGATLRIAATLDSTLLAQIVARNVAIEAVTEARVPILGQTEGAAIQAGRSWAWSRLISPTGDARIVRVDVSVRAPTGQVLSRLTMIRPPTPGGDR